MVLEFPLDNLAEKLGGTFWQKSWVAPFGSSTCWQHLLVAPVGT